MALQKTPISMLQELMQRNQKPLPVYKASDMVDAQGMFSCAVTVGSVQASATARTKREAKHKCAENALQMLMNLSGSNNLDKLVDPVISPEGSTIVINYVGQLNEYCSKNSLQYPKYTEYGFNGTNFAIACNLLDLETLGRSVRKKDAKQIAAQCMLEKVQSSKLENNFISKIETKKLLPDVIDSISCLYSTLRLEGKFVSSKLNICRELDFNNCPLDDSSVNLEDGKPVPTEEESRRVLQEMGIKYETKAFVRQPLIVVFRSSDIIDNPLTILQDGETHSEAIRKLLARAVEYIRIFKDLV